MAPKKQRIVGGSSSNPSTEEDFDNKIFVSRQAQDEFDSLMMRLVIKERGFAPSSEDGELADMVDERGWADFCAKPESIPLSVVKEFYANAKMEKNGLAMVRGKIVDYGPAAIRRVVFQPDRPRGAENWTFKTRADVDLEAIITGMCVPGTVWKCKAGTTEPLHFPAAALTRYARAWFLFLSARIMPSSHVTEVSVERAIILWAILNGYYIDLGSLIHQNILKFLNGGTTGGIPHAVIVTNLCYAVGVRWHIDEVLQRPTANIDHHAINRMTEWPGGVPHPRGLGYVIDAAGGGNPPPEERVSRRGGTSGPSQSQPSQGAVVFSDAQFRRLMRRLDTSHEINSRFAADLTHALDGVYQQQGVQVTWPIYGAHTVYPPPDTPPEEGGSEDD